MLIEQYKQKVADAFSNAVLTYDQESDIQCRSAGDLTQKILQHTHPETVLEIGCGTGILTSQLYPVLKDAAWTITDLSEDMLNSCQQKMGNIGEFRVMDGENPAPNLGKFEVIVSNMTLQWFENMETGIRNLRRHLTPKGTLIFSVPGPASFQEWKQACQILGLVSGIPDYPALKHYDTTEAMMTRPYKNAFSFARSLKALGAHIAREEQSTVMDFRKLTDYMGKNFRMTWHLLYVIIPA